MRVYMCVKERGLEKSLVKMAQLELGNEPELPLAKVRVSLSRAHKKVNDTAAKQLLVHGRHKVVAGKGEEGGGGRVAAAALSVGARLRRDSRRASPRLASARLDSTRRAEQSTRRATGHNSSLWLIARHSGQHSC